MLCVSARLTDGSRLEVRDYLFADGSRKYAYTWLRSDGKLRQRWDNAPHWPDVPAHPHHTHLPGKEKPSDSSITNLEDLLAYAKNQIEAQPAVKQKQPDMTTTDADPTT